MRIRRAAVFLLLLAFGAVALVPIPVAGLSGAEELRERREGDGQGHEHDKAFAARKPAQLAAGAALKRPSAPPLRRTLFAVAAAFTSLVLQAPERGDEPVTPAELQVFNAAHSNPLRAPPV